MTNLRGAAKADEDAAANYLLEKGLTLVSRRWAMKGGEIDLIALDDETIVFVEVRRRKGRSSLPEVSIDDKKAGFMVRAAHVYLAEVGEKERAVRYDLIAIDDEGLRHHEDFFRE